MLKAESNAPSYRPVSVAEDFFMEGNPHGKKIKEKIKKALRPQLPKTEAPLNLLPFSSGITSPNKFII